MRVFFKLFLGATVIVAISAIIFFFPPGTTSTKILDLRTPFVLENGFEVQSRNAARTDLGQTGPGVFPVGNIGKRERIGAGSFISRRHGQKGLGSLLPSREYLIFFDF